MGRGTEIGRVKGLGSARSGTHHFVAQRITSITSMLFGFWFIGSLMMMPSRDYAVIVGWLAQPIVAVPMMLMIVTVFYHVRLGMQVLVEDYVHDHGLRFATMLLLDFCVVGAAAFSFFCVAKIAFTGVSV